VTIKVHSVDGSQVQKADVAIVDTVTLGSRDPLGFVADSQPMNVAFPTAKGGRIIMGNAEMSSGQFFLTTIQFRRLEKRSEPLYQLRQFRLAPVP